MSVVEYRYSIYQGDPNEVFAIIVVAFVYAHFHFPGSFDACYVKETFEMIYKTTLTDFKSVHDLR